MARFRSLLVRKYRKVDSRRVLEIIKCNLGDIEEFEEEIEIFVKRMRVHRFLQMLAVCAEFLLLRSLLHTS